MTAPRRNKTNTGSAFEALVGQSLSQYVTDGVALFQPTLPPMRLIGVNKVIRLANPWLDFMGCWQGRLVIIEAKSRARPETKAPHECWLRLRSASPALTESQTDMARAWHTAGALVMVLWQLDDQVRLVTGDTIEKTDELGTRRIYWGEGVDCLKTSDGLLDPLETIARHLFGKFP